MRLIPFAMHEYTDNNRQIARPFFAEHMSGPEVDEWVAEYTAKWGAKLPWHYDWDKSTID